MEIAALTNQDLIGLLQVGLIAWVIWLMSRSNAERQANADVLKSVANTLNTHTAALQKLLEERS